MREAGSHTPRPEQLHAEQGPEMDILQVLNGYLSRWYDRTGCSTIDEIRQHNPNIAYAAQVEAAWKTVKQTDVRFIDVMSLMVDIADEDKKRFGSLGNDTPVEERIEQMMHFAEAYPEISVADNRYAPKMFSKD